MQLLTKAPRGTQDILPSQSFKWQYVEESFRRIAGLYGFREMRTPTFEHTELFCRSVGDTTDVVQKEMYTFLDKGNRSITLRPEGTAGVVRAVLENGLLSDTLPLKLYYITSCFRYEKPQAGRLREFHQFGVECFGAPDPSADAEIILVANSFFESLGLSGLELQINSIGCPQCRSEYHKALTAYFEESKEQLCETCLDRLQRNPMRILDCKSPACKEIAAEAPRMMDYNCEDCRNHFDGVTRRLKAAGLSYKLNKSIVRGLDYYTKTVFEFVTNRIGAQGTVCGGGRYDGLVEQLGGPSMPGIGFGLGIERLILLMEKEGVQFPSEDSCDIYIASIGEKAEIEAFSICQRLRGEGFFAECDKLGRSIKAQMKYADKISARLSMVLGDNELENGRAKVKNMRTGTVCEADLKDGLVKVLDDMMLMDLEMTLEGETTI